MPMKPEEIFDKYYDKVYSYALFRVQNIHDAQDITSDVFLKAVKNIERYDEKKALVSTWLFTIAENTVKNFYRARRDTVPPEDAPEIAADESAGPLERVLANERAKELYAALARLDERQRSIVLLRYYGEMSTREIAKAMQLSETNVETILHRSKKILKTLLEKCEVSGAGVYNNMTAEKEDGGNARQRT